MAPPVVKKAGPASPYVQSDMAQRIKDSLDKVANFMGIANRERLERAADEGANLALYTPRALEKAVSESQKHLLTVMDPARFQDFAARLSNSTLHEVPYITAHEFRARPGYNRFQDVMQTYGDIGRESGWSEVPELRFSMGRKKPLLFNERGALTEAVEDYPFVQSHEGRHRNMAIEHYLKEPKSLVVIRPQIAGFDRNGVARSDLDMLPFKNDLEARDYFKDFLLSRGRRVVPEERDYSPLLGRQLTEKTLPKLDELFSEGGEVHMREGGGMLRRLATRFEKGIADWYGDNSRKAADQVMFESRSTGNEAGRFGTEDWLSPKLLAHPSSVEMDKLYVPDPNVAYGHTQRPAEKSGYNTFRVEVDEGSKPGFQIHTHPPLTVEGRRMPIGDRLTTWNNGGVGPIAPSRGDLDNWLFGYGHYPERAPNLTSYIHGGQGDQIMALGTPDYAKSQTSMSMADMLDKALRANGQFSEEAWKVANDPDVRAISYAYGVTNPSPMWGMLNNEVLARHGVPVTIDKNARYGKGFAEDALNDVVTKLFQRGNFAEGGEVQHFDKGNLVKRVKGALSGFADKATKHIDEWKWNPLEDVAEKMPVDIPQHVLDYGDFMRHMTNVAGTEGLTPRDVIKAFTTTRASIQRQARSRDKLDPRIPLTETGHMIRPEGAFADWLQSPMGEKYLKYASEGEAHPETIEDAMRYMRTFGLHNKLGDDMTLAPSIMPGREAALSKLIADSGMGIDNMPEWFKAVKDIPGIDAAKRGFLGSMLGYGRLPTLDARQLEMNVPMDTRGMLSKFGRRGNGRGGEEAVERLADRIRALDFGMPEEYRPFDMHLGHHTMWDAAKGDVTPHADLQRMMLNRANGGPVQKFQSKGKVRKNAGALSSGPEENLLDRAARVTGRLRDELLDAVRSKKAGVAGDTESVRGVTSRMGPDLADSATARILGGTDEATRPIVSPEDIAGGILVGGMSDRTPAGNWLQSVGGVPLSRSMFTQGGSDYPIYHDYLWASAPNALTGMVNAIDKRRALLKEKYPHLDTESLPSYFTNKLMGYQAGDQAHMMMEGVVDLLKNADYSRATERDFNDFVRKRMHSIGGETIPPLPDFPGVRSPKLEEYLMNKPMALRSKLISNMDVKEFNDRGIPNPTSLRLALTDPYLLFAPEGTPGRTIGRFDVNDAIDRLAPSEAHGSYPTGLKGTFMGGFDRIMRPEDVFPDYFADPRIIAKKRPQQLSSFRSSPVTQYLDQQWLDNIMPIWEKTQRGWEEGGPVNYYAGGGQVGNVGNVGDPGTLGSDVVPFFDYQTPTEGEGALSAMASNNVRGYATGGSTGSMFLDSSDNAALDYNEGRFTPTPEERRAQRLARIDAKNRAADAELYLSDPLKWSESREPGYRWDEAKQFARGLADLPGYIIGGVGDLHDLANEHLPERLQMERFLPNSSDVNEYIDRITGYEPRYSTTGGARDVGGLLATTGGSMPVKAPGVLNLLKRIGSAGLIGMQGLPFLSGEEPPLDRRHALDVDPTTGETPAWLTGYADGGPVNINYPNGGQVPGYRFGGEFDQWYGEPGVSMYAGGGQVGQPDVIEYASNYNRGMIPDSYEGGAPRFSVDGALRALGDLVYAGEPGQKNIGNYYINRSDPQVATGEMPQEGYVKTYPQQRGFRPMPDEIDPRYHSRDKSMSRSDMLYNFDHGGPVEMKEGGFLHDVLGTLGGLAGNLIPIPIVGPAIGKFFGHTVGNLVEGNTGEIGDDAGRDFTMGMYDADNGGFRPERILSAIGGLRGRDPGAPVISDSIQNFMARGGSVDDDALLYHAIDTQNFSRGGALRYCGGGYAR